MITEEEKYLATRRSHTLGVEISGVKLNPFIQVSFQFSFS